MVHDDNRNITKTSEERRKETLNLANAWKCSQCFSVLGYTDSSREVLRIKYKELYVWIKGGEVSSTCRYCGKVNSVISSDIGKEKGV
jgi:gamma-glutamylcysteine synthetase